MDFVKRPHLVAEQTSSPIRTEGLLRKCLALLALVVDVVGNELRELLGVSVSKLALLPIATSADFNPVLAHLSLVLGPVDPLGLGCLVLPGCVFFPVLATGLSF